MVADVSWEATMEDAMGTQMTCCFYVLVLNGNPLPWVEESKYFGNTLVHIPDGFAKDAKQKRAIFMLIGFPHVIADSERDVPGIEPGTLGWYTSALTTGLQEVRQSSMSLKV